MDNQQRPSIKLREFCSMLYGCLDGKRDWGKNGYTYMID